MTFGVLVSKTDFIIVIFCENMTLSVIFVVKMMIRVGFLITQDVYLEMKFVIIF